MFSQLNHDMDQSFEQNIKFCSKIGLFLTNLPIRYSPRGRVPLTHSRTPALGVKGTTWTRKKTILDHFNNSIFSVSTLIISTQSEANKGIFSHITYKMFKDAAIYNNEMHRLRFKMDNLYHKSESKSRTRKERIRTKKCTIQNKQMIYNPRVYPSYAIKF